MKAAILEEIEHLVVREAPDLQLEEGAVVIKVKVCSIDGNMIHYREVSVQGSHGSTPQDHREALDVLATRALEVSDLMSHKSPLDSIEEAFLFAEGRQGMHVAVIP